MRTAVGLSLVLLTLAVGACGGGQRSASEYPPLPGPKPDAEVVAVWDSIASREHPAFYTYDSSNSHRLLAYDWTGKRRGELTVSAGEPFGVYPSADGTMLLLTHGHIVSGGKAIGRVARGSWAGDNTHICTFLNTLGGPGASQERKISANASEGRSPDASLFLEEAITGQVRRVVDFGSFGEHGGPQVLACDAAADRAVITETFVGMQSSPQVVGLSNGQLLYEQGTQTPGPPVGLVASEDGSLLAEGSTASLFGDTFLVRAIPAGNVIAHISGGGAVAFSGDNTRVLTVQYLNGSSESGKYQVIELATGRVVWSAVLSPGTVLTRPHSSDFLVASSVWENPPPGSNTRKRFEDVWLVPATGSARLVLKHSSQIASD